MDHLRKKLTECEFKLVHSLKEKIHSEKIDHIEIETFKREIHEWRERCDEWESRFHHVS
jgi:chromosome segregation ATPase